MMRIIMLVLCSSVAVDVDEMKFIVANEQYNRMNQLQINQLFIILVTQ